MNPQSEYNPEKLKERIRQEWSEAAEAWRKWHPQVQVMSREATAAIVEAAEVQPGTQVLDLASGSGQPAMTLSQAVAPNGQVTATDLSPDMLRAAEDLSREQGLTNIAFQQADAEDLPFPDQSFDVITCRFGVMFFPNVNRALGEVHRVLRPGGRVAFITWGPPDQNPYFSRTIGVFAKYVDIPQPNPGLPGPFRFAQPGSLSRELEAAGFQNVEEEQRGIAWSFPGSLEEAWESTRDLGAPFRRIIASLEPAEGEKAVGEVKAAMGEFYDGNQVNFPAVIGVVTGVRPS